MYIPVCVCMVYDAIYRDDPEGSDGVLIVSNDPNKGCEIKIQAQNIFTAIK